MINILQEAQHSKVCLQTIWTHIGESQGGQIFRSDIPTGLVVQHSHKKT